MLEELTCDGTAARACPAVVSAACLLLEIIYIMNSSLLLCFFMVHVMMCLREEVEKVLAHGG